MLKLTAVFKRNIQAFHSGARFVINQGGTSSSKTWSILQLLILIAQKRQGLLISIVSESLPHLKRGAMRDFIGILNQMGLDAAEMHNKSSNRFTFGTSVIEFFSADDGTKLRGARRDILYLNEVNNVHKRAWDELTVRTKLITFCDFNPVAEFYVHEFMQERNAEDFVFIKSTYKDNQYLDESIVHEIEARRHIDPLWWKTYGEGEIGLLEGVIFTNWKTTATMPDSAKRVVAVDFGFTNDPTAILDIRYSDGAIHVDEIAYQTGLTNADIARIIKAYPEIAKAIVVCDSAEPKSIAELQLMGIRAVAADKGADSVRAGIDLVKQYPIFITERSTNVIKEERNYRWKTDKNGKSLQVPIDYWNHAMDAKRYGVMYLLGSATKTSKSKIHIPNRR